VIIPCYNQGHYIDEAVESVSNQTYQDFEIIIVNDGSTDPNTIAILNNYCQPKTVVIHTHNQGLASARNNGIQMAQGEYILPLDADDKIGNTYLEKAVALLQANADLGIVYAEAEFFGSRTGTWRLPPYHFPSILLDNVIFCAGFFRRSDWQKIGGYRISMKYGWEDYDFWLSIIELGKQVHRIPEPLFFYRKTTRSMVDSMNRETYIYSYSQLFKNHPQLYSENIEILFAELVDLRALVYRSTQEQSINPKLQNSSQTRVGEPFWELRKLGFRLQKAWKMRVDR